MTVTPERYLHNARVTRRERNALDMRPCSVCGRPYMPGSQPAACSTTCFEIARQRQASA